VQPSLFPNLVGGQYYGGNINGDTVVAKQVLLVVAKTPVMGVYTGGKGSIIILPLLATIAHSSSSHDLVVALFMLVLCLQEA
jgi:hypothetical protein